VHSTRSGMNSVRESQRRRGRLPKVKQELGYVPALGRMATPEEIYDSPLLFDERRYWRWACKAYGKPFMDWVRLNWATASEREIQVMHRAWIAAGGPAR
jgi:hypothetical protein